MTQRRLQLLYEYKKYPGLIRFGSLRRESIHFGLLVAETKQFLVRFYNHL